MVGAICTHIFRLGRCTEGVLHLESSMVQQVGHYDVHIDGECLGAYGCGCILSTGCHLDTHLVACCRSCSLARVEYGVYLTNHCIHQYLYIHWFATYPLYMHVSAIDVCIWMYVQISKQISIQMCTQVYIQMHTQMYIHMSIQMYVRMFITTWIMYRLVVHQTWHMGWLWWVGFLKLWVLFAEYLLFYWALLQKRPIILRSQLIIPTPHPCYHDIYIWSCVYKTKTTYPYIDNLYIWPSANTTFCSCGGERAPVYVGDEWDMTKFMYIYDKYT